MITKTTKGEFVTFEIEPNIRSQFTFRAKVRRRSGKVVSITAGCRYWTTFGAARGHYGSDSAQTFRYYVGAWYSYSRPMEYGFPRWSDAWLDSISQPNRLTQYAVRAEARAVLRRLQDEVTSYAYQQSRRRARDRKKARSRK
jgi:hypothetical protein